MSLGLGMKLFRTLENRREGIICDLYRMEEVGRLSTSTAHPSTLPAFQNDYMSNTCVLFQSLQCYEQNGDAFIGLKWRQREAL